MNYQRRIVWIFSLLAVTLRPLPVVSQTAKDTAVMVSASVTDSPPAIMLSWPAATATSYAVSRKGLRDTSWTVLTNSLPGTATSFIDVDVAVSSNYEYRVYKSASTVGYGYVYAGIQSGLIENRGSLILLVDDQFTSSLATELSRLERDLVGDGWKVIRHDVSSGAAPADVKASIVADYNSAPSEIKALLLFGHIPQPYSGDQYLYPDGHDNHRGAWPADVFYGDVDGVWTDTDVTCTLSTWTRQHNVPGDGKYDQRMIPSPVDLQVGRVDFYNMPAFALSEEELLRQYLNKDHKFRCKFFTAVPRMLIDDHFGYFSGDFFDRGSSLVPLTRGEAVYGAMARMGYDMCILGNHDWAYGGARLFELMDKYPFTVLGSNLATTRPSFPDAIKRYVIKDFDGVKVGFFGITLDSYGKDSKTRPYLYVLDCLKETGCVIKELKHAQVDLIVAVTHLGLRKMKHETASRHPSDIDLAGAFPDIDVIVGGHSHTDMNETETRQIYQQTGTIIVQTSGLGKTLGRLTMDYDPGRQSIRSFQVEHTAANSAKAQHLPTKQFISAQYEQFMPDAAKIAGELVNPIELYNMGYWYSDFIKNKTDSDLVLLPRNALYDEYDSFKNGIITIEDLFGILYNRYLIKSEVKGSELLKFCDSDQLRHRFNPFHHKGRPFSGDAIYYSGMNVLFDCDSRSVHFQIDTAKTYTLVTPWPFSSCKHLLPERTGITLDNPVPGLILENSRIVDQTTWEMLISAVNIQSLEFTRRYANPPDAWQHWTDYFESGMKKH